jgi:hypothetical protein
MILEKLADYLDDNAVGTLGTDIFLGELPLDKSDIISLVYVQSPEPDKSVPYYTQLIDVWARYSKFDDGYGKLQEIFDLLHRSENYQIEGYHIYLSYASGMIQDLDRDAERRHLFRLTLGFVYRVDEIIS